MLITKGMPDEIFAIRAFSIKIDVVRLIDSINCKEFDFDYGEMKIKELLSFIRSDDIKYDKVNSISERRRDEPIIVTYFHSNCRIIDGNHRLLKRQKGGFDTCKVVCVRPDILDNFTEPLGF